MSDNLNYDEEFKKIAADFASDPFFRMNHFGRRNRFAKSSPKLKIILLLSLIALILTPFMPFGIMMTASLSIGVALLTLFIILKVIKTNDTINYEERQVTKEENTF